MQMLISFCRTLRKVLHEINNTVLALAVKFIELQVFNIPCANSLKKIFFKGHVGEISLHKCECTHSRSLMLTNISKSVLCVSLFYVTSILHVTFIRATETKTQLLLEPPNDKSTTWWHVYTSPLCSHRTLLTPVSSNKCDVFRINMYKYLHSPS